MIRTIQHGKANVRRRTQRGFSLLYITIMVPVMVAMLGISADLGRVYIAKNELQAFVDASAIAAAYELDGTQAGITRANKIATDGPSGANGGNRWYFGSKAVSGVTVEFAKTYDGTYEKNPADAAGYRFVRVFATDSLTMAFLPVIAGIPTSPSVSTQAVAGQGVASSVGESSDPFSPDAVDINDANFGFVKGGSLMYTLRWAPPGVRKQPDGTCSGDLNNPNVNSSEDRGYIDVGQGNGNQGLTDAIINKEYFLTTPMTVGGTITMVQGEKNTGSTLEDRVNQDLDTTSETYAEYKENPHNGRRIFNVPVNDPATGQILGFAAFFLPNQDCFAHQNVPCCVEYIGPALKNGRGAAAGEGAGLYEVKLFR